MLAVRAGKRVFSAETAASLWERARGLMFSRRKNILFFFKEEGTIGIHSFFVFFPFDAVYLDSKKQVVEVVKAIKPFTPYVKNRKPAMYLLEMCEKHGIRRGDKLEW
ncbi:MAG: DUF192 domain-containing protein [Candidatus ainarchaeum sp.]|nr:DUF192 domain-containing protein [Candidatus ainarchaeum sp.]